MKQAILSCLVFFCLLPGLASGQAVDSQQISGTVTDPSGAAIAHALVTVTNDATKLSRSVESNDSGNYTVLNIPVGVYTLTASIQGFKKSVTTGVNVDVGGKPSVEVTLAVGQVSESVEVKANAVMVQTTSAEVGTIVTSSEATQLQLNGRNYIQLLTLAPGVSQTIASGFNLVGTFGVSGNSQSVNGIRTDSANYFIDGVDNKDNGGGGNNFVNISPDSLQQFRGATSTYDASYGGTSGVTVSVAMRSGGTKYHGVLYEYFRNDAIQAYGFQQVGVKTPTKSPLRYNNFGFTLGGPLFIPGHFNKNRDKLFFFAAMDFKRLRTSTNASLTVPTQASIVGLPSTPTGRALFALYPLTPNDSGTYGYQNVNPSNQKEYLIKLDYNINEKNQLNFHFVHDNLTNFGGPLNFIAFDRTIPGLTSSVQYTHTFNPKTVNVIIGSFSGNIISEGANIRANPAFGLKSILRTANNLNYSTLFNFSAAIPQVNLTGFSSIASTARTFDNYQRIYAAKDDFSRLIGNHSLKAGIYAWRGRKNQTNIPAINGTIGFTSVPNLLQGNFATYQEGNNISQVQARFTQIETYVQDDWTVNRQLTLNLGLRWQYMQPIYSTLNNASSFYPSYYDPLHAATVNKFGVVTSNPYPYNGLVLPGSGFPDKAKGNIPASILNNPQVTALFHNLPLGLVNTNFGTWAPRAGFAYDIGGKQRTVLHGGFGISYERVEGNYYYGSVSQLPFTAVSNLTNGNVDTLVSATPGASGAASIGNAPDQNLSPPRIWNYSIGVQHRLTNTTVADLNYVGTGSNNLTYIKNLNQAAAGTEQANPGISRNALKKYLGYADINQFTNGAHSNYNSLQTRVISRFSHGGLVSISYTWSKALTNGSGFAYAPQDSFNLAADYGPANFNQPHIFVASYVYPLPFWLHEHALYKKVLSGWQVSGITRISSGLPINVVQAGNISTSGNTVTSVSQRPNLIGNPYFGGRKQYLNPAAFATPTPGTYGTFEYDGARGPLFHNWDASVQKNIPIHESISAEFRAEMFNVPNHLSNFTVSNTLGGANFGQVTATTDARTMEFVLRINF
jgi:hypothetical protein